MAVFMESCFFISLCLTMFAGKSSGATVPAIYVFGDSLLDSGNNNFLQTHAKSNYTPYGIDLPGEPTGRFTNGATGGDFIAQLLGLPHPPAYLSLSEASRKITTTGINYASGGSGILSETGTILTIYKLGGRKFVVYGLGALGCLPIVIASANPKPTTLCVEDVNNLINIYNNGLPIMLQRLASRLQGFTFVQADLFSLGYDQFQDPVKFGYADGRTPCCDFGVSGMCIPGQNPCSDRDDRLFYDAIHPVQLVNYQFAGDCFSGNSRCTPINIKQLALKQS
ncbi:GDSL esterase/lipase At4g16230-like isoform X3 [Papaver somniferum]|uniref:GDSL esterase/lipase At4g16230-like isoform X3 n=1 Tax=Papaver somniferum TaxID=3469 RepID=UPI000E7035A5|nr:GDSL esterase/lipase At4g16230-like isoform X3 [Papaver somniferum]